MASNQTIVPIRLYADEVDLLTKAAQKAGTSVTGFATDRVLECLKVPRRVRVKALPKPKKKKRNSNDINLDG